MKFSSLVGGLFLVVPLLIIICYAIIVSLRPSPIQSLTPTYGPLSVNTQIATASQVNSLFQSPSSATFSVYIYLNPAQRTSSISPAESSDLQSLFSFGSALKFELLPPGESTTPVARLKVLTSSTANHYEYIQFPYPSTQEWVLISIVRDSRRFTVYYNTTPIVTQLTNEYPVITTSLLTIGNPKLNGQYAFPMLYPSAQTIDDIQLYLNTTADTRGKPILPISWSMILPSLSLSCPGGVFCPSINVSPVNNPLKIWSSPYA